MGHWVVFLECSHLFMWLARLIMLLGAINLKYLAFNIYAEQSYISH